MIPNPQNRGLCGRVQPGHRGDVDPDICHSFTDDTVHSSTDPPQRDMRDARSHRAVGMLGSLELLSRYLQAPESAAVGINSIQLLDANGKVARDTAHAHSPIHARQQSRTGPAAAAGFPLAFHDRMAA